MTQEIAATNYKVCRKCGQEHDGAFQKICPECLLSAAVNVTNHSDPTTWTFLYGRLNDAKNDIETWGDLRIKVLLALLSEKIKYSPGGRHRFFCEHLREICETTLTERGEDITIHKTTVNPAHKKYVEALANA
jgi:hypothetical protein